MKIFYTLDEGESWTQISAIVDYPDITPRLNTYGICNVLIRDFEGALFSDWYSRDFLEMKVEDESENILFRGFLLNKKFTALGLSLELAGIAELLERKSFGHGEEISYILDQGIIKTAPYAGTSLKRVVRPNSTELENWLVEIPNGANHYTCIDDNYEYPDEPDLTDYIRAFLEDDGENEEFGMENLTVTSVQEIKVYVYGKFQGTPSDDVSVDISIDDWGTSKGAVTLNFTTTASWQIATFSGLTYNQAQMNALQVRIRSPSVIDTDESFYVYCMYAEINYTGTDSTALGLATNALTDFTWEDNRWIKDEKDVALLVVDNTNWINSKIWDSSAITRNLPEEHPIIEGTNESTLTFEDYPPNNLYIVKDTTEETPNLIITLTIDGDGIPIPPTNYLKSIQIEYSFRTKILGGGILGQTRSRCYLQILKDTEWRDVDNVSHTTTGSGESEVSKWCRGVENLEGKEPKIFEDTHEELAKYFDMDVGEDNYVSLKGLRFKLEGWICTLGGAYIEVQIDYIRVKVFYEDYDIVPVMKQISDSGNTWVRCTDVSDWNTVNIIEGIDTFQIGENTRKVIQDISSESGLTIEILPDESYFTKYIPREFKGKHCIDVLEAVCKLEGCEWYEDYINNRICLIKQADFVDSEVDLTQDNYLDDWEYEDQCNQVKYVYVWGKTSYNNDNKLTVNIKAVNKPTITESVIGDRSKQIKDDTICTKPEAQDIADSQAELLKDKRPSIRIPLIGTHEALQMGTTVDITMARPTIAKTPYPIRMINRSKFGKDEILTTIYAGLGETEWDEKLFKAIKKLTSETHRLSSEKLSSTPYESGLGGVNWNDITGRVAGVEAVIDTEIGAGESIDNAIDSLILTHKNIATAHQDAPGLILTHKNIANAHHTKTTDGDVENIITAELVNGQSIDNAIDALIATHHDAASADHDDRYYTEAEVDAKISNDVYGIGWDGVTDIAPSKNAVYDKIEGVVGGEGVIPDLAFNINGDQGWIFSGDTWYVVHADTDARMWGSVRCPSTQTDWKILIITFSEVADARNDSGKLRVGVAGEGEEQTNNNVFDDIEFDINHPTQWVYKYSYSDTFSASKADMIRTRWSKDNNAGTGALYLLGIYLVR